MAQDSKIEWTDHTANLWWGCTKVHAGCDNCYAETLSNRFDSNLWGNDKPRRAIKSFYKDLNKFQKNAEVLGVVHKVFVGSMMDIFEKPMKLVDAEGKPFPDDINTGTLRDDFFMKIQLGMFPNLLFLLLTKRPSNINKMIPEEWKENPPKNVMFGTSPVDQETARNLIPHLMNVNGRRFLSIEPMLGSVDLGAISHRKQTTTINLKTKATDTVKHKIDWIIVGGESGHHRRPIDLEWARSIREQCKASGTPFFFKQVDKVLPIPTDLMIKELPTYYGYNIRLNEYGRTSHPETKYVFNNTNDCDECMGWGSSVLNCQEQIDELIMQTKAK